MSTWDNTLPTNGSKMIAPSMPDTTLTLDQNIEQNGLQASSLFGSTNSTVGFGNNPGSGINPAIRVDSANNRIVINRGATNNVLMWIGYCGLDGSSNNLYGILMFDETGVKRGFWGFQ